MKSAQAGWRCAGYESNSDRLRSIQPAQLQHAFAHFGAEVQVTSSPADVLAADALVLPGVGAFQDGMQGLEQLGLIEPIKQKTAQGTLLLGICLGMQMLFDESEEFGLHKGLGLIPGRVVRIPDVDADAAPSGCRTSAGTHCTRRAAARIFPVPPCRMCSRDRNAISSTLMKQSPQRRNTAWPIPCMAAARCAPLPKRAA